MLTLSQEINMQEIRWGVREAALGGGRVELGRDEDRAPEPSHRAGVGGSLGPRLPVFLEYLMQIILCICPRFTN